MKRSVTAALFLPLVGLAAVFGVFVQEGREHSQPWRSAAGPKRAPAPAKVALKSNQSVSATAAGPFACERSSRCGCCVEVSPDTLALPGASIAKKVLWLSIDLARGFLPLHAEGWVTAQHVSGA